MATEKTSPTQPSPRARELAAHHSAILEAALDCIITIDDQGRVLEFNPAAERTFGYRRDEAIGRPDRLLDHSARAARQTPTRPRAVPLDR